MILGSMNSSLKQKQHYYAHNSKKRKEKNNKIFNLQTCNITKYCEKLTGATELIINTS